MKTYSNMLGSQMLSEETQTALRKRSLIKKHKKSLAGKNNRNSVNVSSMQGDDKPHTDTSNEIHIGGQVGYPQESVKRSNFFNQKITFKEYIRRTVEMTF